MELLVVSFIAGMLTILAPCTLTLLPIILGGSTAETGDKRRDLLRPLVTALSLGISVVLFTLLLKGTTLLFNVGPDFWKTASGVLIIFVSITFLFPSLWDKIAFALKFYKSEGLLHQSSKKTGFSGSIILGAALGPVFSSCSPTYLLLISTILPQDFTTGALNTLSFAMGLFIPMLLIGYGGLAVARKFRFAANPNGWFKKLLGILLLLTGLAILTGFDKVIEAKILEAGYLGPIQIEQSLLEKVK